ncbi:hypothetical protein FF36_02938 [Frankia torreyi]|uniref:DUF1345 domain-containing protein n=1 Tax=Frankia torreyi TaxID=1856 RepID=A0A0D8BFM1_9ACTN|nr:MULTISPECIES: hypothetical protein [Frankia]KJE22759.1 hypothetical protein FF36_02938 [Frankia torreyi]KQM04708.1 hypothetical protein FF86_102356 [Frankia sp. CpI1-P]
MTGTGGPDGPEEPAHPHTSAWDRLSPIHLRQFARATGLAVGEVRRLPEHLVPAWLRPTDGERRLPVLLATVVAIALQWALPSRLTLTPRWLLPGLEIALLAGLTAVNPVRLTRKHPVERAASLLLAASVTTANGVSAALLAHRLVRGTAGEDPAVLLSTGAAIYLTNIIAFALWYWEFDRGGPFARAQSERQYPDLLFPQMSDPANADPRWEPTFVDYLFVAFTNSTAFSPTDTMPMTRWAKLMMMAQSTISIIVVALVLARAVNILR